MKKLLTVFMVMIMIVGICSCTKTEDGNQNTTTTPSTSAAAPTSSADTKAGEENWDYYNERAEAFVTAMANGDFDAAAAMFDATMAQALPASALQSDIWTLITGQAGAFVEVHEIENALTDGYYVCATTSRHEQRGVTLRIVFSEDGLIAGMYIDGFPSLAAQAASREGFTEYPVVVGEGTDYPLDGILSMPENAEGKVPAVILVHGSGPQDMDETIYQNKPFRDIADYLASNGIAVIRYDKRSFTHGASMVQQFGGSLTVMEETVKDAILATELVKSDSRIDQNRVFILGHSLGGMLAPRIHAEGGDYAGLILLAGSPRSLLDISFDQQMAMTEEMPMGDEKTEALAALETYNEQVEALLNLPDDQAKNTPMSGGVSAYYFKEMDEHPAEDYIEGITKPFLVLQGSKDFQVYPERDFALYEELLGGRSNATLKLYEGLNHLFMTSMGGSIAEYQEEYKAAGHVDSQVLQDIALWIMAN